MVNEISNNNKRKLFLVSPMLHQGGFERVCITTARLLQDEFDVTIIIFSDKDIAYDVNGLNIVNLDVPVNHDLIGKVTNVFKRANRLKHWKKTVKPEICYSFGPTANRVNCLSTVKGVKTYTGIRNYTDIENKKQTLFVGNRSDLIICCAREIENYLNTKLHFNNTATLYNLYDISKISSESEGDLPEWPWPSNKDADGNDLKVIISMGRDDDQKCFWHMLKAFKLVHDEMKNTRLVLLGAGSFDNYKKLSKDLGIEDAVYFAGMRKDPYKFLKRADLYLLTSANEGFPNALVEGMSLGLTPVATNCLTGPAEILLESPDITVKKADDMLMSSEGTESVIYGDYGVLVPVMSTERNLDPNDLKEEENLSRVLLKVLQNEDLMKNYGTKARLRAEKFNYDEYKKQFMSLT